MFFILLITFQVLTINVRGLSRDKLDLVANFVNNSDIDVRVLQETNISNENSIQSLSSRWRASSIWSQACGRQGGIAILFSRFLGETDQWKKDPEG